MRIGIIGCGLIGAKRAEAARLSHEIVRVADVAMARAEALAAKVNAKASADWRAVIEADVDAVVVATTHDNLAAIAKAAVEAGKHVLVEKPAARTAAELAPLRAAAQQHKRVVKVGFNHRFHPSFLKARAIVDSGVLGPIMFVRGRYGHGGRVGYEKEWRFDKPRSGGGELLDQGSHLIDLARWFAGDDLTLAYAHTPTFFWDAKVEDNAFVALTAPEGRTAWLHASWTEWKNIFCFEIVGGDGKLQIDGLGGSYGVERLTHFQMLQQMGPPETTSWEFPFPDKSWARELAHFIDAIATGARPWSDLEEAAAVLAIVDAAYQRTERT
ncbi:MAG: Gfo/Idh/MocA family protein [Caulobacteraceae bacterium]